MPIKFFEEDIQFKLSSKTKIKDWIKNTIIEEGYSLGAINYIFCSDQYLLQINIDYLSHDYFTDIITFNTSDSDSIISSDIFISVDRVKENSSINGISFIEELMRVMIHGVLHLIGYNDHTDEDVLLMRSKENYYLEKF